MRVEPPPQDPSFLSKGVFRMVELEEIRAFALSLPEVQEGPPVPAARRIAAFKVAGKSFVGVEKGLATMTVSLGEEEAKKVAARQPDAFEEIWRNGKVFMGLRVDLSKVRPRVARDLIERSWRHTAPRIGSSNRPRR
jgi:hypothetical protein